MTQPHAAAARPWLLVLGSAAASVLALAGAVLFFWHASTGALLPPQAAFSQDRLQAAILGVSLLLTSALSLIAAWHGVLWLRGDAHWKSDSAAIRLWQIVMLVTLWLACVWGAQFAVRTPAWRWSAALFHVLAIAVPIYLLFRLATGGLMRVSLARLWGTLAAGMWLGTGLALIAEGMLMVLAVVGTGAYFLVHPEHAALMRQLLNDLGTSRGLPEALAALGPLLDQPVALLVALFIFAGLAPLIEEGAKSAVTWVIVDHLGTPAAGFVTGAIAGAGFALLEGLFASSTPDPYWGTTLLIRGGSSVMHITAAAIAGWGIALYRLTRRLGPVALGYVGAMLLHGVWNASVIVLAFGGLRLSAAGLSTPNVLSWLMIVLGISVLAGLCIATPMGLVAANHHLRRHSPILSPAPASLPLSDPPGAEPPTPVGE